MSKSVYEMVTERIIEELEKGFEGMMPTSPEEMDEGISLFLTDY